MPIVRFPRKNYAANIIIIESAHQGHCDTYEGGGWTEIYRQYIYDYNKVNLSIVYTDHAANLDRHYSIGEMCIKLDPHEGETL